LNPARTPARAGGGVSRVRAAPRTPDLHADAAQRNGSHRGRPAAGDEICRAGTLAGMSPAELAERFGTPLFVYDLDVIERRLAALRSALPAVVDIAYALKANPALAVVAHLASLGAGADVASDGELETALVAGVPGPAIVLTGPGKLDALLARAIDVGLRAITVESLGELGRLEAFAAARDRCVPILLRLNATGASDAERVRLVGDGGAGKFGMGPDDAGKAARLASRSPHLDLLGVHAFGASNVLDAAALAAHAARTVEAGRRMAREAGFELRLVDMGGGLGIPYEPHETPLDLASLGAELSRLAAGWRADPTTARTRVLLEPGRFLVGPAGAYLARVVDRKTVGGRPVAILDGGIHHLVRPALVGQEHRIRAFGSGDGARPCPVTVAGPLCTGLDVFSQGAVMRPPAVGDLLAVLDAGAYGFTESMPWFLSHGAPAEAAVRRGDARVIRPREDPRETLSRQRMPAW
jgi:diaminopimelate decarboxylase